MYAEDVIIEPVQSEKAILMREKGYYVFYVAPYATRGQIREALKTLFSVEAEKINIIQKPGKLKRVRVQVGYSSRRKKAVIKLKPGQEIKVFEGV